MERQLEPKPFWRQIRTPLFFLPVVARGEYLEGFDHPDGRLAREFIDAIKVLNVTSEVARTYATVARELRARGRLIGANDLWIGSTAKTAGLPLVTKNAEEFARIPGLVVLDYTVDYTEK